MKLLRAASESQKGLSKPNQTRLLAWLALVVGLALMFAYLSAHAAR